MTEEELEQKVKESSYCNICMNEHFCKETRCANYENNYIRIKIELLEKENEELKNQIKLIESVTDANADKVEELKAELKNYAKVINELMGTQLTDTDEIGRLIEIAQFRNWSELS